MQTKIRFFSVTFDFHGHELISRVKAASQRAPENIVLADLDETRVSASLYLFHPRKISIARRDADGEVTWESVETLDRVAVKIHMSKKNAVISAVNSPRSSKFIDSLMSELCLGGRYFYESMEIDENLIKKHVSKFDAARLVSAKVRDFAVYEGAVGRFEVTSKNGLMDEIAPFLRGKFYRVDSLTYELTHKFSSFLITYSSSGSIKINDTHMDMILPSFEKLI
ncbi:hypothetical protein [Paraburkholderia strydomiana]|uniref:hypothetical protein n=1 Tax=Paraburkholderia strydomiana TaxID=1245417 RepID=UPI001BEB540C|nr:hypothetical protein [Paraburkholderia strydomiana]MBT2791943.1 hypothetical protein [Paraburkholderia strydomiana]